VTNIVQVEANNVLGASVAGAAYSAPTTPIKLALMSANGSNTAAGTEISGGSYARLTTASCWAAASAGSITTNTALTYTNMPAVTTVGVELWDSSGTPVRKWFGSLTTPKTTGAGDTLTFPSSSLTASLS
jgi:hypothetical protein